jgi:ubiquinone/menaquinone biosynthesis C-methylase UbiE
MNSPFHTASRDFENVSYFNRWAKAYDHSRISQWFQYTQNLAISEMSLRKDSKVLDVGCGTGFAVLQLAAIVSEGRACGIDISPKMIEQARMKVSKELSGRVEFCEGDSNKIPYSDGCFDNILCTNSFHHYPDPILALREMQRVLKPSGQIVIFENAPDLSWYTWLWDRVLRLIEKGHVKYYPSYELGDLLRRAELEHIRLCHLRNERFTHGKFFASIQLWSGLKPRHAKGG